MVSQDYYEEKEAWSALYFFKIYLFFAGVPYDPVQLGHDSLHHYTIQYLSANTAPYLA